MSTLTKVFVVLLVAFSIAFATMTVSVVSQTTNWKALADDYQQHAQIADTTLRNLIASNAAELTTAQDTIRSLRDDIADSQSKLRDSTNEVTRLQGELARTALEKSSAEVINRGLLAQLQSSEAARDAYRKQRDELERSRVDVQRRNIDLNDRVNELTAQVTVLMEQKRQFEQQINILREENQRLAQGTPGAATGGPTEEPTGAALTNVVATGPTARSPIRGEIVDVSGNIVTISIGAADGVKDGMLFVVHRDDQYIGDIKIDLVDPKTAAGRPTGARFGARVGDKVTDAVGLSLSPG